MYVAITSGKNENLHLKSTDAWGKGISDQQKEIQKGNRFPVNNSKLKQVNCLMQILSEGETKHKSLL